MGCSNTKQQAAPQASAPGPATSSEQQGVPLLLDTPTTKPDALKPTSSGSDGGDVEMGATSSPEETAPPPEVAEQEVAEQNAEEPELAAEPDAKDALLEPGPTDGGQRREVQAVPSAERPAAVSPVRAYLSKFAGAGVAAPPRPPLTQTGFSFIGSFVGIAVLGLIHMRLVRIADPHHFVMLIGPFGAMAVLVFSASKAPLAQPRNVVVGNTIGGLCGWAVWTGMRLTGLEGLLWLGSALSVAATIVIQERLGSVHPPGGATALSYVICAPLHTIDYLYVLCPAMLGAVLLVCIGLFTNNLSQARAYPQTWGCETEAKPAEEAPAGSAVAAFFKKFKGAGVVAPPVPPLTQSGFSFFGSFVGISTLALLDAYVFPRIPLVHLRMIIGSFGAMAVLVFSACKAPLAQPKNAVLGNTIGGVIGVTAFKAMELAGMVDQIWLSAALAVSLTIVLQELTGSVHPPGGATALIFVTIPLLQPLSYWYVLAPAFLGAVVMVCIGLLTNNLSALRTYPQGWS